MFAKQAEKALFRIEAKKKFASLSLHFVLKQK
jgi:hypothetical protein